MPLNLIASIGGMSEFSMMTSGMPWQLSYSLFGFGMIAIGFFTAIILNKIGNERNEKIIRKRRTA
jgi:magnesium transporter